MIPGHGPERDHKGRVIIGGDGDASGACGDGLIVVNRLDVWQRDGIHKPPVWVTGVGIVGTGGKSVTESDAEDFSVEGDQIHGPGIEGCLARAIAASLGPKSLPDRLSVAKHLHTRYLIRCRLPQSAMEIQDRTGGP